VSGSYDVLSGSSVTPRAPAPGRFGFLYEPREETVVPSTQKDGARPDKAAAVAELTESFRESSAAVLTEYRGLTVAQLKELRRSLAGNATYAVVKNTLTKIAARDAGVETLEPMLQGPSAVAFVTGDPVIVAKGLRDFAKAHPLLVVKGGVLDGRPLTADEVRKLADLESREVLLAKLAGGLNAPAQKLASALAAPLSQFARLLGALEAKAQADPSILGGGAGTPAAAEEPAPAPDATPAADTPPATETTDDASAPAADAEMPTDATPGVEETPDTTAAEAAGDEGAAAQAVADSTDVAPDTDVAGDATSAS
jgi:large subunit ribosomal protein L10